MGYAFSSLDELGDGFGFRKIREALGVKAFGVNAIVFAPGVVGRAHAHSEQDELYFVHRGTIRFQVAGETRDVAAGGLVHVESTTPRRLTNATAEEAIVVVVGAKDGYVGRDGRPVDEAAL